MTLHLSEVLQKALHLECRYLIGYGRKQVAQVVADHTQRYCEMLADPALEKRLKDRYTGTEIRSELQTLRLLSEEHMGKTLETLNLVHNGIENALAGYTEAAQDLLSAAQAMANWMESDRQAIALAAHDGDVWSISSLKGDDKSHAFNKDLIWHMARDTRYLLVRCAEEILSNQDIPQEMRRPWNEVMHRLQTAFTRITVGKHENITVLPPKTGREAG